MNAPAKVARRASIDRAQALHQRLGFNVPREHWPTASALKGQEAAGFDWVQVHAPPVGMLLDWRSAAQHGAALRSVLDHSKARLVLHAPDELRAGTPEGDRALEALVDYAGDVDARFVVYHAANLPLGGIRDADHLQDRLLSEEAALRRVLARADRRKVVLCLENLAPVYPGPPHVGHDPRRVRELVRRLDHPCARLCLDLGHAHITSAVAGRPLAEYVEPVLAEVGVFHLHDNLGARRDRVSPPGVVPLRLDLHLAPGAGSLPWGEAAGWLLDHPAPLQLEVAPPHRPDPLRVATVTAELLLRG